MLLIGVGHKARQGKDVFAESAVAHYSNQRAVAERHGQISHAPYAQQFRFAGALYQECRELHGMTTKDAPLLQRIGQERRLQNSLYWVKKVFNQIEKYHPDIALISDVRYQNEAEYIKSKGGYLVNIFRLNQDGTRYIADDRPADHPSETELDYYNWDFQISAKSGQSALVGEYAVTLVEYLRAIKEG